MALYRHVETKEEILDLVVGHMLLAPARPDEWPEDWEPILRLVADRLRDILQHHPVVLETLQRRAVAGPHALEGMERLLAAFARVNVDARTATGVYGNAVAFVFGHVALHSGRERARTAAGRTAEEDRARITEQIAQLPTADYPHVASARDEVPRLFDDEQFQVGMERLIRAVRAELP
jgi:hypothetical protein